MKTVTVKFRITQQGKNPFTFEHSTTAPEHLASVEALAKKTAYVLANQLHDLCAEALLYKLTYDRYLTAFRPKAAFQIEIVVDNTVKFYSLSTKGADAIRLTRRVDGEDETLSRGEIADKFMMLASMGEISKAMANTLTFADEVTNELVNA